MAVNGGAGAKRLTSNQEKAIIALLSTSTVADAASAVGIGARTLERWLSEDADFVAEYRAVRTRVVEGAIGRLQEATTEAVEALKRNMGEDAPPSVQVRAAQMTLDYALKAVETYDLLERLDELQRDVEEGSITGHRVR